MEHLLGLVFVFALLVPPHVFAPPAVKNGLPAVSRDRSRIAFVSSRGGTEQLFAIASDGTHELQLTNDPGEKDPPMWAADGKLVFSTFANGASDIFEVDVETKRQTKIGVIPGRSPRLSPDGSWVVYGVGPWTASRLVLSKVNGAEARQLTGNSSIVWSGWWSPDGKRIVFPCKNSNGELTIWIMNADGSGQHQVTHIPPEEGSAQMPAWSPDGHRLAVQVGRYTEQEQISHVWVVNLDSGAAQKLAAHEQQFLDETPSWFPDGKRIAFQSNRSGNMEVWTMNSDGSDLTQVTGTNGTRN